jgi:hypothetical protein
MALGLQGQSKSYGPFAASIVFGLSFAMVGTLFIVPLAYTSLIRLQERMRFGRDRRSGERPGHLEPVPASRRAVDGV